jgi:hypothetical protein
MAGVNSSSEEEPVAWLRRQIEARLALAREAAERTDGHWWRRMADAGHYDDHRLEPVGHLWAGEPVPDVDGDVFGGEEIVVYDEGRPSDVQFDHIAANDPQDTIARCEAELAILDEHASDGDRIDPECVGCAARHPASCECGWQSAGGQHWRTAAPYPCRTVRLLASGYKHRPGYREEDWKR